MDRKEKEQAVAELHERLKGVKLAVLAGYSGMNVEKITALRNELRKTGTEFRVVKNTLLGIAAQGTDFAGLKDNLKGPLSLSMIGGDVASVQAAVDAGAVRAEHFELPPSDYRELLRRLGE